MLTDKPHLTELLALLLAHDVKHVVLCPGSRNIALVKSMAHHPDFKTYAVTDERSAAFFALGLIEATGKPAAVCCTSGSALANFFPAVTEAFYQRLPLVVISADRPAAWIDQMDGQTIHQPGIFGRMVKASVQLKDSQDADDLWQANREINAALLALRTGSPGPIHINCPIREPFFALPQTELPAARVIQRVTVEDIDQGALDEVLLAARQPLGLIGQMRPTNLTLPNCVCWSGEVLANVKGLDVTRLDALLASLSASEKANLAPDLLISMGGHLVSKRTKQWLRAHRPQWHWHVSPEGDVVDLFQGLTTVIEASPQAFLAALKRAQARLNLPESPRPWVQKELTLAWPDFEYSAMKAVVELVKRLPQQSSLHVANSSAVRYVELAPRPAGVDVACNRGTSGIEGSMSTWMGFASLKAQTDLTHQAFMIIGDLSFFYDMNALWRDTLPANLRLLVLNNKGGEIFHMLPGLNLEASGRTYVTADHNHSVQGWCEDVGFDYECAYDEESLQAGLNQLVSQAPGPKVLEVFTYPEDDAELLKAFWASLATKE